MFRKLAAVAAAFMLLLGFTLVAQGFIDTKDYREQIIRTIKERTGKDVVIKGRVTARLLPAPGLYVPGFELRGVDDKDPSPTLTASALTIRADLLSLFSDKLSVSSLIFEGALLEVRRADDGKVHWDWLENDLLQPMMAAGNQQHPMTVAFIDSRMFYYNDQENTALPVKQVNLTADIGSEFHLSGSMQVGNHMLTVVSHLGAAAGQAPRPFNLRLGSERDELSIKGELTYEEQQFKVTGGFSSQVADLRRWIAPTSPADVTGGSVVSLPVKLEGGWQQQGWSVKLDKLVLEGLGSKATGDADFVWKKYPDLSIRLGFSEFQLQDWQALAQLLAKQRQPDAAALMKDDFSEQQLTLPDEIRVLVKATAEKITVGQQIWQNANVSAVLQDAAITINQLVVQLPGDASLALFGIVSQGAAKNLRFEGSVESQGSSLRDVLTLLDPNASGLPDAGLGAFSLRSNLFISHEQVRLSEADVKLNELNLSGGLVAYFDGKPRVEADVKLRDINFDYFRDVWREKRKNEKDGNYFLRFDKAADFGWLKKLKTNIDFKVIVDGFTFMDKAGQSAAFRLFAQEGEFGIYNLRFYYPNHTIEASFNLNVKNEVPFINLMFNDTSDVDTRYFMAMPEAPVQTTDAAADEDKQITAANDAASTETGARPRKDWSEELFDTGWMEGYHANFDISVGRLIHRDTVFQRFRMKSALYERVLTIQALSFGYWKGRCDITGSVYGGKVPGMSLGFTITNADISDIITSVSSRKNITGRLGVSGSVTTSGVNPLSWIQQADAKLTLNGVGVNVAGFNLKGIVDTVFVSRTTADVVNNVNLVLPTGSTEFLFEGYLNIKNGIVRTPGITLKSAGVTGNLTGELRLIPWTMNLSTLFQFPAMSSETVPTLSVQLTGSVDDADVAVDTDSLEAYVSKRIIGN
jgi:hypothetical protein